MEEHIFLKNEYTKNNNRCLYFFKYIVYDGIYRVRVQKLPIKICIF